MHECLKKLVDYEGVPDEAEVESLTSLLRTIGASLDASEKGHTFMDVYFQRINNMVQIQGLPSRLKFMLMVSLTRSSCTIDAYLIHPSFYRTSSICVMPSGSPRTPTRALKLSNRSEKRYVYLSKPLIWFS